MKFSNVFNTLELRKKIFMQKVIDLSSVKNKVRLILSLDELWDLPLMISKIRFWNE